jgi:hypothetical protein
MSTTSKIIGGKAAYPFYIIVSTAEQTLYTSKNETSSFRACIDDLDLWSTLNSMRMSEVRPVRRMTKNE